jgi:substrate import-associated zinc metallohydrolase lipoprotein
MMNRMKILKNRIQKLLAFPFLLFLGACYPKEDINVAPKTIDQTETALDTYIRQNFTEKYGVAVRYKWVDRYVAPDKRVTPPELEKVQPMLDFLEEYWIEPYLAVPNGKVFFEKHVPAEVIFIGSLMYNNDGTVTLGTADAGAKITLTDVNSVNVNNRSWLLLQLIVIYHEFAHIVHQKYKLPNGFESISPTGYTSAGSWFILTDTEALERGFVSPYGTSSLNEDFAECVAFYLTEPDFDAIYINDETCSTVDCEKRNEGRAKIRQKMDAISSHYKKVTGIDLAELRQVIQAKLQ